VRRETGGDEHFAAQPYAELPAFMAKLRARKGLAAQCIEFVILTACRTSDAVGAPWSGLDFEARLWAIPAAQDDKRFPLSEPAVALLNAFSGRHKGKVFSLSNNAMLSLVKRAR
jgi:integrase